MRCSSSVVDGDRSEDGDGRGGEVEIRDEKTWASLSRGGEEMRYREEDERLALQTETKETGERERERERGEETHIDFDDIVEKKKKDVQREI